MLLDAPAAVQSVALVDPICFLLEMPDVTFNFLYRQPTLRGRAVAWLDDARIPYRDLCFLGAKPQVEADLYIDDSPGNITGLRKAGNDVIVFDQPYNRDMAGPRAGNWSEVEEIVMERYTAWSGVHGVQPVLPGVTSGDRLHGQRPT